MQCHASRLQVLLGSLEGRRWMRWAGKRSLTQRHSVEPNRPLQRRSQLYSAAFSIRSFPGLHIRLDVDDRVLYYSLSEPVTC